MKEADSFSEDSPGPPNTTEQSLLPVPEDNKTSRSTSPEFRRKGGGSTRKSLLKVLTPKPAGRRQSEFIKIFKDAISEEEPLIADFSCALVRDILVQGRLFLTPNYCCFHSNILRWETTAVIPFTDITSISKEKTIKIIPNAISVVCNQNKYIFTSFTARDRALLIFNKFWRVKLNQENKNEMVVNYANGEAETDNQSPINGENVENEDESCDRSSNSSHHSEENQEPVGLYQEEKGSKSFLDVVFAIPMDTLFSLIWLTDSPFWKKFMSLRKTKNWYADEWQDLPDGKFTRECRCLQHVQLPMGAKDVPQVDNHTMLINESGKRIVIDSRTFIREVPYGESFHVLNRWQFLRADNNRCRVRVATSISYDKACWQMIKSFIDKNAMEGNQEFLEGFRDELNRFIESGSVHPSPTTEESGDGTSRPRNGTKISVKKAINSTDHDNQAETISTPPHVPNLSFPRGIDHMGAAQHWAFFLFFFIIGAMIYTAWSFNTRLGQLETTKLSTRETNENDQKVEYLLKELVNEVRQLRQMFSPVLLHHATDEL